MNESGKYFGLAIGLVMTSAFTASQLILGIFYVKSKTPSSERTKLVLDVTLTK